MSDLQTTNLAFEDLPPNAHVLAVMGADGDTKHMWDTDNAVQVDAARKLFAELKGKGYLAFRVVTYEKKGRKFVRKDAAMPEFEPDAGRMHLQAPKNAEEVPPVEGEPVETFDPKENHVLIPPMAGG